MKSILTCLVPVFALLASVRAAPFTSETAAELSAPLDADGDGRLDLIVVGKGDGIRQLAMQQADGTFVWAAPRSTGLDGVSALSIGRFTAGAADGFTVAAPAWNRVHVFPLADAQPVLSAGAGVGPSFAVAINLPGAGDDPALDDLVLASRDNGAPDAVMLGGYRWTGAETSGFLAATPTELTRGNRIRLAATVPWLAGAMRAAGAGSEFVTFACDDTQCAEGATAAGLPAGAVYAWGAFSGDGLSQFLFHVEGGTQLILRPAIAVVGGHEFAPGTTFDFGQPIARVAVLDKAAGALLLVVFGDGSAAGIYDFDGTNAPTLRQSLTAPPGAKFSSAGALGAGDFLLLSGPGGGTGLSTGWQRWNLDGAQHTLAASGTIPTATAGIARGNVFVYADDPALVPDTPLHRVLGAGEWSVTSTFNAGVLEVTAERLRGTADGLGDATAVSLGGGLGAYFPALNQSAAAASIASVAPAIGTPAPDVFFSPAPGTYHLAPGGTLAITLQTGAATDIRYRTTAGTAWQLYTPGTPLEITASTTVTAFATNGAYSPLRTAAYVIAPAPPLTPSTATDANHDGIADAWAAAFGLADANADADGDTFTNRDEYLAATDPFDNLSAPAATDLSTIRLIARPPGPLAPPGTFCEIVWPAAVIGATLESTADLTQSTGWLPVAGTTVTSGGERLYFHESPLGENRRFFRLRR